jgi:hypothetical protein
MDYPTELLDSMRQHSAAAKEAAIALKAQAEESLCIQKIWEDLLKFASRGWSLHVIYLIDKQTSLLKHMRLARGPGIPELEELYRLARERGKAAIRNFPRDFEQACKAVGLSLDPESRHPGYSLDQRFFQLDIDDQKGFARLSDTEGNLAQLPADTEAVVETIQRERNRIFGRPFDAKKFFAALRKHYVAVAKKDKLQDGVSIPIRHLTRRMGKNVKRLRTDEFAVDLSRLIEQGPIEVAGVRLDLQQTKDTNEGMLLPGKAGRGYIGFIVFRSV